jgi:hypothetical protein
MMWLVQVALRRPLSVAVMAVLMLVLGVMSFAYMNVDIFPVINLPVVMMVWSYPGLSPYDMERRMVTISERAFDHGQRHRASGIRIRGGGRDRQDLFPAGLEPGHRDGAGERRFGEHPASNATRNRTATGHFLQRFKCPIAELKVYGDALSGQQLFDYAFNFARLGLFTIPGFSSSRSVGLRGP